MKSSIKIGIISCLFWIIILISSSANAASASIVANSSTVTVGNKVTVTVKVTAAAWNLNVSGSTKGNIVGYNGNGKNKSISKTFSFTPKSAGTYKVNLNGDVTDANDKESKIGKSVTVTAKPKVTSVNNNTNTNNNNNTTNNNNSNGSNNNNTSTKVKSSNANLSILGVKPSKYDFTGYRWSVTEYNVTVPNDVTKLTVYATPASSKARYSVSGNTGFKVGTNVITVKVTAENGNTKKYKIYVTREAEEEETIPNVTDDNTDNEDEMEPEEGIGLESLEIKGYSLDKDFDSNIFNYKVEIGEDEISALELKDLIIAKSNYNKAKIYIDIEKGDEDDYFIFDTKVRVADTEKEYASYDIKFVKSLSATANVSEDEENIAPEEKEANQSESENKKEEDLLFGYERNKVERFALILIIINLLIVVIILSIIIGKKNAKLNKYKDREESIKEENKEEQYSGIDEYRKLNSSYNYDTENQETNAEERENEIQNEENNTNENTIDDDNSYKYESIYRSPRRLNSKSGGRHF